MISEKLIQIAENEPKIYEAGKADGIEQGKKSEWDAFWDAFQLNGERRDYSRAFHNITACWNIGSFKPKYDIICEGDSSYAFYAWENNADPIDIGGILKRQGITIDTSRATNLASFFAYGNNIIGEFPTISCVSAGANTVNIFRGCQVTRIEKLIVTELTSFNNMFLYCGGLVDIVFEGTIAKGDLNMRSSTKLSKASIYSVINALSTTTSGLPVTLSKTAVDVAFKTGTTNNGSTSDEWKNLIATKSNWTISLL